MKRILAPLVLACAIALGGCTTTKAIIAATTAPSETVQVTMVVADKVLVTAHQVAKAAHDTLIALTNAGVLHGNSAAIAKGYYDTAMDYLAQADKAHDLGNAVLTHDYAQAVISGIALATTTHDGGQ